MIPTSKRKLFLFWGFLAAFGIAVVSSGDKPDARGVGDDSVPKEVTRTSEAVESGLVEATAVVVRKGPAERAPERRGTFLAETKNLRAGHPQIDALAGQIGCDLDRESCWGMMLDLLPQSILSDEEYKRMEVAYWSEFARKPKKYLNEIESYALKNERPSAQLRLVLAKQVFLAKWMLSGRSLSPMTAGTRLAEMAQSFVLVGGAGERTSYRMLDYLNAEEGEIPRLVEMQ